MEIQGIQIIGTQRSGSNLLRVILNQSDELVSPHPAHVLTNFVPLLPYYGTLDAVSYRRLVEDVVDYIHVNPVAWGVRLDKDEIYGMARQFSLFELNKNIYEFLARQQGARYWCCKSMGNMYVSEELETASPDLKYIYLYRDGRDVALSFQKAIVGEKHPYHIAKQWHEDQQACLRLTDRIPSERLFMLNYEQLIRDPEQTIRQLCAFLGIGFQETMLHYYTSDESRRTADGGAMWTNLTKPVMHDNANKFLREMAADDIRIFESVAVDSLVALGYEPVTPATQLLTFAPEEVAIFNVKNAALKQGFKVTGDDAKKRQPQLTLLKRIKDILAVTNLAREAGKAILDIYQADLTTWDIQQKSDDSPLTLADLASHRIISEGLRTLFPDIPMLSEEGNDIPYEERKTMERYWCVDPLDGTKEFISRNGEFTVNIALMVENEPVFGVIYVPVTDVLYYGVKGEGSFKTMEGITRRITANGSGDPVAVGSKSHKTAEEEAFLASLDIQHVVSVGSSLKFCLIAEGGAQVYYRHGPTMEWDTAAGHAIAVASGARMMNGDGSAFTYNKPRLVNGPFICYANYLHERMLALNAFPTFER